MSYHIYNTRGIVLSYKPRREADRVYSVLTRDLGLIHAAALGVRKEESKLRGALEPLVVSNLSLVRGKEHWRITSAEVVARIQDQDLAKPLSLLEQLVQGEAENRGLYDAVESALMSPGLVNEVTFVAEILYHLGYLEESDLSLDKQDLVRAINKGLEASSLIKKR